MARLAGNRRRLSQPEECFEARPADMRRCQACQSEIAAIIARNRIEPWT
jgi:hypothetical protein